LFFEELKEGFGEEAYFLRRGTFLVDDKLIRTERSEALSYKFRKSLQAEGWVLLELIRHLYIIGIVNSSFKLDP